MDRSGQQRSWFARWLGPPRLATPEQTQQARTFWIVAVGTLLIGTAALGLLILEQPSTAGRRAVSIAALWVIVLTLIEFNRRGLTRAASWCLVLGMIVYVTQRSWTVGGIRAPLAPLYVGFAIMGSLLLGRRGGVVTAIAALASGTFLVLAKNQGWLPPPEAVATDFSELLFMAMAIALALLLQDLFSRAVTRNLDRAEAELTQRTNAQARLGLAIEAGRIGVWEMDMASRGLIADKRVLEFYGIDAAPGSAVDFETWAGRLHPEDRTMVEQRVTEPDTDAGPAEFRVIRPDGSERHLHGAALTLPGKAGEPPRMVGVVMDVTTAKLAQREREQLVHQLRERVKELRLLHRAAQLFQQHSGTDAELLQTLVGMVLEAWQYPECCQARITYGQLSAATPGWRETQWMQAVDFKATGGEGRIEVAYTEARPAADEGPFLKEERALLQSLQEVLVGHLELRTHQRQLENLVATRTAELARSLESLKQLERLRDDLVHMVVHDMRSPLSALIMSLDMVTARAPAELQSTLSMASRTADSLKQMANTLLDVSRLESGRMPLQRELCNLAGLAADVKSALAVMSRTRKFEVGGDAAVMVSCDRALITRVIENLVGNAIKHTPADGRLQIEVRARDGGVRFSVADEGAGVPAASREKIFEKFGAVATRQDRAYHSAGLGLAFCKLAVQAHGGTIGVADAQPRGSVFWFELPG